MANTQKPIKATLDNSSDECKTQKPILIQLEDIPQPTDADAGKVLGVDEEGKYALTEGGGGGVSQIGFFSCVPTSSSPITISANDTVGVNCTIFGSDFDDEPVTIQNDDLLVITEFSMVRAGVIIRSFTLNSAAPYIQIDNLTGSNVTLQAETVGIFGNIYR